MKRIFSNIWLQLFLGLMVGVAGVLVSFQLAMIFLIKYAGLFGGAGGDQSPLTLTIALIFGILIFIFPTIIWLLLNRFGSLKSVSLKTRILTIILFLPLPFWIYLGLSTFSKLQTVYEDYSSVRADCIIKNGVNKKIIDNNTEEIECKDGIFNGFTRTYNSQGVLVSEGSYLNGKLNGIQTLYYDDGKVNSTTNYVNGNKEGAEASYNEDGSTGGYTINNEPGLSRQVYYQDPEYFLVLNHDEFSLENQNYLCTHQGERGESYTCLNNVINGEYIEYLGDGTISKKINYKNGVLDGIFEDYSSGKPDAHLEFKDGKLDGKAEGYDTDSGVLRYEGEYTNGLQEGVFRMYDYQGNLTSEVVFKDGQVVKVNK